mmetsp:Transcript_34773/g.73992  ORF Transcript_34773/g.73992 Transcript_34773/m.73992 type:complete len:181 (-) Transcript_34773:356-898(-)
MASSASYIRPAPGLERPQVSDRGDKLIRQLADSLGPDGRSTSQATDSRQVSYCSDDATSTSATSASTSLMSFLTSSPLREAPLPIDGVFCPICSGGRICPFHGEAALQDSAAISADVRDKVHLSLESLAATHVTANVRPAPNPQAYSYVPVYLMDGLHSQTGNANPGGQQPVPAYWRGSA